MSENVPRRPALSRELVESLLPPCPPIAAPTIQITISAIHIMVCNSGPPPPPRKPRRGTDLATAGPLTRP